MPASRFSKLFQPQDEPGHQPRHVVAPTTPSARPWRLYTLAAVAGLVLLSWVSLEACSSSIEPTSDSPIREAHLPALAHDTGLAIGAVVTPTPGPSPTLGRTENIHEAHPVAEAEQQPSQSPVISDKPASAKPKSQTSVEPKPAKSNTAAPTPAAPSRPSPVQTRTKVPESPTTLRNTASSPTAHPSDKPTSKQSTRPTPQPKKTSTPAKQRQKRTQPETGSSPQETLLPPSLEFDEGSSVVLE